MTTNYNNNIKVFKTIISSEIIKDDLIFENDRSRELLNIKRITTLSYKFRYYLFKYSHKNNQLLKHFICSQKYYYILSRFVNLIYRKKCKIYNVHDIYFNELLNSNTFNVYINKFIYKFTYSDFTNIINNSLFNFYTASTEHISNMYCQPLYIKNPYTNIKFDKNILYNFYIFCLKNNYKIPTIYQLYYESEFELNKLFQRNENYMTINSIKKYIKNSRNELKYTFVFNALAILTSFINKHFIYSNIKLLLNSFKIKFYNLDYSDIYFFDNIAYIYILVIYYYKTRQIKNFVDAKFELIKHFLSNRKIKFSDSSLSSLSTDDIIYILDKNYENIIKSEIEDINIIYSICNESELLNNNNISDNFISNNHIINNLVETDIPTENNQTETDEMETDVTESNIHRENNQTETDEIETDISTENNQAENKKQETDVLEENKNLNFIKNNMNKIYFTICEMNFFQKFLLTTHIMYLILLSNISCGIYLLLIVNIF